MVRGRGACRHPDGVVRMLTSAIGLFRAEFEAHAPPGPCARCAGPGTLVLPQPPAPREPRRASRLAVPQLVVDPVACAGHGLCAELLPERIALDDWGYPIVDPSIPRRAARARGPRGQGVPGAGAAPAGAPVGGSAMVGQAPAYDGTVRILLIEDERAIAEFVQKALRAARPSGRRAAPTAWRASARRWAPTSTS